MEPNRIPAKLVVRRSPRAHLASTLLLALPTIAAESTHVCFKKISQRRRSSPLMFMTRADLPIAEHRLKKRKVQLDKRGEQDEQSCNAERDARTRVATVSRPTDLRPILHRILLAYDESAKVNK